MKAHISIRWLSPTLSSATLLTKRASLSVAFGGFHVKADHKSEDDGRYPSDRATIDRIGDFARRRLMGEERHVVAAEIFDRKLTL
jgi:hypothetical protein